MYFEPPFLVPLPMPMASGFIPFVGWSLLRLIPLGRWSYNCPDRNWEGIRLLGDPLVGWSHLCLIVMVEVIAHFVSCLHMQVDFTCTLNPTECFSHLESIPPVVNIPSRVTIWFSWWFILQAFWLHGSCNWSCRLSNKYYCNHKSRQWDMGQVDPSVLIWFWDYFICHYRLKYNLIYYESLIPLIYFMKPLWDER